MSDDLTAQDYVALQALVDGVRLLNELSEAGVRKCVAQALGQHLSSDEMRLAVELLQQALDALSDPLNDSFADSAVLPAAPDSQVVVLLRAGQPTANGNVYTREVLLQLAQQMNSLDAAVHIEDGKTKVPLEFQRAYVEGDKLIGEYVSAAS